jgi:hypothetical protein
VVGVVALAAFLRKGYFNGRPFWLDEAWVADSLRAPAWRVLDMSYPGPPLWAMLLRAVPKIGGAERYRVIAFLFSLGAVAPAAGIGAMFGRGRARAWHALAAALTIATLPAMVLRQDLKQYTVEAFVALALLWLIARADDAWSARRVVAIAVGAAAVAFATTAAFVCAAGLAALVVSLATARRWREATTTALIGIGAVGAQTVFLITVTARGPSEELRDYWSREFIPTNRGLGTALRFVGEHVVAAFGNTPIVASGAIALIIAGVWFAWRAGRRALALTGPLLFAGMTAASAIHVYPFLDRRTSLFLVTILAIYGSIAVVRVFESLMWRRTAVTIATLGLLGIAVVICVGDISAMRPSYAYENVRDQVRFISAHRADGDVIAVGYTASFGFAYYWPDRPSFLYETPSGSTVTFRVVYPRGDGIVIARGRTEAEVRGAVAAALAERRIDARVWLVLSHDDWTLWRRNVPDDVSVRRIPLRLGKRDALLLLTPKYRSG